MIHQKIFYIETKSLPLGGVSKLLILDRDGVINEDKQGYFHDKNNIVYIERNLQLIKEYIDQDWVICVATNQSGIGRGMYSQKIFVDLCERMFKDLLKEYHNIHNGIVHPKNLCLKH